MAEEIKRGLPFSYVGLIVLVSGVSVVLTFCLRYLLGRFVKKRRFVKVITRPSENLLNVKEILGGGIKCKFYLPSNQAKDIKELFPIHCFSF